MKKNIVITILAVLVVGLGCFLIYDKFINDGEKKESSSKQNSSSEKEEKDFDLVEAKKLIDNYYYKVFNFFGDGYNDNNKNSFTALKAGIGPAITDVEILNEFECSDAISLKTNNTYYCQFKNNSSYYSTKYANYISYEDLNKKYKELYGNENDISKTSIKLNFCDEYVYISSIDSFVEIKGYGCGGYVTGGDVYGVKNAKVSGNKLVVNVGYGAYIPSVNDYTKAILNVGNDKVEIITNEDGTINSEEVLGKYLNKLDTYEFDFMYEDGIYKLKNVTKR